MFTRLAPKSGATPLASPLSNACNLVFMGTFSNYFISVYPISLKYTITRTRAVHTQECEHPHKCASGTFSSRLGFLKGSAVLQSSVSCWHLTVCFLVEGVSLVNPGTCPSEGLSDPSALPMPNPPGNPCTVRTLAAVTVTPRSRKPGFCSVSELPCILKDTKHFRKVLIHKGK